MALSAENMIASFITWEIGMARALRKSEDTRQQDEPIMDFALRNDGRLPTTVATEICPDPTAEYQRLRDLMQKAR
jgi:hypothetical protein